MHGCILGIVLQSRPELVPIVYVPRYRVFASDERYWSFDGYGWTAAVPYSLTQIILSGVQVRVES